MRLVIDTLIAALLAVLLAGVLLHHRQQQWRTRAQQRVHLALAQLHEQVVYHGALGEVPLSASGFPLTVSPVWFGVDLPQNYLVPGKNPWLDIAPEGDRHDQPPDPVVTSTRQACFWYNPQRGIFRARVLPQDTDQQTLRLYNRINGTALKALPHGAIDPDRQPITLDLGKLDPQTHGESVRAVGDRVIAAQPRVERQSGVEHDEQTRPRPTLRNQSQ